MYKTAIIGAGVVGAMAARRLSSYDMDPVSYTHLTLPTIA